MSTDWQNPIGWPFLPALQDGQLIFPTLEQSVRDSIRVVLMTRPGEQLMRPRFGAGLQNFLDKETRSRCAARFKRRFSKACRRMRIASPSTL